MGDVASKYPGSCPVSSFTIDGKRIHYTEEDLEDLGLLLVNQTIKILQNPEYYSALTKYL